MPSCAASVSAGASAGWPSSPATAWRCWPGGGSPSTSPVGSTSSSWRRCWSTAWATCNGPSSSSRKNSSRKGFSRRLARNRCHSCPAASAWSRRPTGAAIRDILQVLRRRNSAVQVLIYPVKVQGEGSALEIAEGIRWFDANPVVDVLIVGRGGGSLEDLWAFNEEPVARAIFACRIPVISAVGHEIDFTIADFVADLRAPTPSAAAEVVAGAAEELSRRVEAGRKTMLVTMGNRLAAHRNHLKVLVLNRALTAVPHRVRTMIQKVDEWHLRLQYLVHGFLQARGHRLADLRQRLLAASPARRLQEQQHRLVWGGRRCVSPWPRCWPGGGSGTSWPDSAWRVSARRRSWSADTPSAWTGPAGWSAGGRRCPPGSRWTCCWAKAPWGVPSSRPGRAWESKERGVMSAELGLRTSERGHRISDFGFRTLEIWIDLPDSFWPISDIRNPKSDVRNPKSETRSPMSGDFAKRKAR